MQLDDLVVVLGVKKDGLQHSEVPRLLRWVGRQQILESTDRRPLVKDPAWEVGVGQGLSDWVWC